MITEKNNVFYCDCGFSFQRGRSGAHYCADGLRNKLAESEARCAALAAEVYDLKHPGTYLPSKCETPALDAFLAEVRAQGVEMMAAEADQLMDEFGDDSYKVMVTADLQRFANAFAAQLRQESAQ
ncbi:hypothetical protein C3B80_07715 [Enterobacter cloacae]|uniref:hypothetical protein n=1 Tax=Enterobacter roggenkampii TaxID=1812935 RepID=UPI0010108F03|nr:hypothetical protein [Enterobacter roggenkampii]QAZ62367.1 hypothetical protein C3B80_07715 [Enterobacter cloacae]